MFVRIAVLCHSLVIVACCQMAVSCCIQHWWQYLRSLKNLRTWTCLMSLNGGLNSLPPCKAHGFCWVRQWGVLLNQCCRDGSQTLLFTPPAGRPSLVVGLFFGSTLWWDNSTKEAIITWEHELVRLAMELWLVILHKSICRGEIATSHQQNECNWKLFVCVSFFLLVQSFRDFVSMHGGLIPSWLEEATSVRSTGQ